MKKSARNKKYQPKPVKRNSLEQVIQRVKPLTEQDKEYLYKQAIAAINAMQFGRDLSTQDFTILCDMLNISLIMSNNGIGNEYFDGLQQAREALQDSKQRYLKTKRLGFTASELAAAKEALSIHATQLEVCTFGEFVSAFDEQEKRIKAGVFYKRDGDLSVGDMKAAA